MKAELRTLLRADAAIAALVGERVDWGRRPQGDRLPAIALICVDDPDDYHLQGASGLAEAYVTVQCWARDYTEADTLANAVRLCVSGHKAGVFRGIFVAAARDGSEYDPPNDFHCISLDLRVWRQAA